MPNVKMIAICDDQESHLTALKRCALACSLWENNEVSVDTFSSGQALLNSIEKGKDYDYIFLDIHMPEINGIELYGLISSISQSSIIFVSSHMENQPSIDKYYPAMLMPKPFTQKLFDNILRAYHARKDAMRVFAFTHDGKPYNIPCRDIYYFSMAAHHLMITTDKGTYQDPSMNLKDIERLYPDESFFRCHKSYIINLRYFEHYDYNNVYLNCGGKAVSISLSKGKGKEVERAYLKSVYNELNEN